MTIENGSAYLANQLQAINLELASLLRKDPLVLSAGAEASASDDLVICGLLGGKDVGKSTLINALARSRISVDEGEVGRGTQRPVAYVHRQDHKALERRLPGVEVALHDADAIRGIALVDLPDFDSEFVDHFEIVRQITPLLDRIIWVVTPRKIGDRVWVQMVKGAIQDSRNVAIVLNKLDELLTDADALSPPVVTGKRRHNSTAATTLAASSHADASDYFWRRTDDWVRQVAANAGFDEDMERPFLLAAEFPTQLAFVQRIARLWDDEHWNRYASDKPVVDELARHAADEVDRLRTHVLGPVTHDAMLTIKRANRQHETALNAQRLGRHYELSRALAGLAAACDPAYTASLAQEAFDAEFIEEIAHAAQQRMRGERQLADELLESRIDARPLLRLVYWPFGWLSRTLARGFSPAGERRSTARGEFLDASPGPALLHRVDRARGRLLADHAVALAHAGLDEELPPAATLADPLRAALGRISADWEQALLDDLRTRDALRRRTWTGRLGRALGNIALWLVLLWFPLLQPLLSGLLLMLAQDGAIDLARAGYMIVSALSAVQLLSGMAVAGAIFVGLVAVMYGRCLRAVRDRLNREDQTASMTVVVQGAVMQKVIVPLLAPIAARWQRLQAIADRLSAMPSSRAIAP